MPPPPDFLPELYKGLQRRSSVGEGVGLGSYRFKTYGSEVTCGPAFLGVGARALEAPPVLEFADACCCFLGESEISLDLEHAISKQFLHEV